MSEEIYQSPSQHTTQPKKLGLEATFLPEIKSYFNTIRTDFTRFYAVSGQAIDMAEYEDITLAMIKKQYQRVANIFKRDLRGEKKQSVPLEEQENDLINTAIVAFVLLKSKLSASQILETNGKNIQEAIGKARVKLFEEGVEATPRNIAKEADTILKAKFKGRAETIAISETQYPAESAKEIEANVLAGEAPSPDFPLVPIAGAYVIKKATKTWSTSLDERTRPAHARADGQTVPLTGFYIVDGEMLRFPRSPEGSAKNIINCRCSSQKNIIRVLLR